MGRGGESLFAASGHMTKMAATPIYGRKPSKIFTRGLLPIIGCSNDEPGVTLTYFTARPNLVTYRKNEKQWIFKKLLHPGGCRQLIEIVKVCGY